MQEFAVLQISPEGKITRWNAAAERLFGYSSPEMLGHSFSRLLTPEDQQANVVDDDLACISTGIGRQDERWLVRKDGSRLRVQSTMEPVQDEAGRYIAMVQVVAVKSEETQFEESNHRIRNTIATIQSIANQTFGAASASRESVEKFHARLQALSCVYSLLTRRNWESVNVADLIHDQLAIDTPVEQIKLRGPSTALAPKVAVGLAHVLQELKMNAITHGALAVPRGRLNVHWEIQAVTPPLYIEWTETGGAPIAKPQAPGFGTALIERSLQAVGGSAELRFISSGLTCAIRVPVWPGK